MQFITELAAQRGELSDVQSQVLEALEGNPDRVFRTTPEDLIELKRLLVPNPGPGAGGRPTHSKGIKSALKVLHKQGRIGFATVHHETYYGSHASIDRLQKALEPDQA